MDRAEARQRRKKWQRVIQIARQTMAKYQVFSPRDGKIDSERVANAGEFKSGFATPESALTGLFRPRGSGRCVAPFGWYASLTARQASKDTCNALRMLCSGVTRRVQLPDGHYCAHMPYDELEVEVARICSEEAEVYVVAMSGFAARFGFLRGTGDWRTLVEDHE